MSLESIVRDALASVPDPEIPSCSILDLGMLHAIELDNDDAVQVTLLPTFAGCPALDVIRSDAQRALRAALPGRHVEVVFSFEQPWTTDRIGEAGRRAMAGIGIAPPGTNPLPIVLDGPNPAGACPYCSSTDTELSSGFGPTPCRAVAYCRACRNPFEVFKPKRSA